MPGKLDLLSLVPLCNLYLNCSVLLHQLGRRGVVIPVLRKYGQFFKTHRIFRQYVWAAVLQTLLLQLETRWNHLDNVQQLWGVHARRLHQKYN